MLSPKRLSPWQHFNRVPAWVLPYKCRSWVLDNGSLTKRLIDASHSHFSVNVTFQGWGVPHRSEAKVLNISGREQALIREVELCCYGVVWVKARSIIPRTTLTGKERELKVLGNRPLGAFLFKSKTMRRSGLEVASFQAEDKNTIYARRSVFRLNNKPLLVSELFMPELFLSQANRKP